MKHEVRDIVDDLGHLIVELLANAPHHEGRALEKSVHVRVGAPIGKHRRQFRIALAVLAT